MGGEVEVPSLLLWNGGSTLGMAPTVLLLAQEAAVPSQEKQAEGPQATAPNSTPGLGS